jgi:hypothetical protein
MAALGTCQTTFQRRVSAQYLRYAQFAKTAGIKAE